MNTIIIYIIAVNLLLAFKLWWDWRAKNKKKRIINHGLSAVIDGALYIAASIGLFYFIDDLGWNIVAGAVLIAISWRWIAFDAIFAKINWGVWDKHGTSSKVDVFLLWTAKYIGKFHILIKLIPVAGGLALILI